MTTSIQPFQGSYLMDGPHAVSPTDLARSLLAGVDVRSVMARRLVTCPPSSPLTDAAGLMTVHAVHAVVVEAKPPCVVTALDIVRGLVIDGPTMVQDVDGAITMLAPETTLHAAAECMVGSHAAHVLVGDGERAVGMVSSFDVAAVLAGHDPRTARTVRPAPARPAISSGRVDRHRVGEVMHRGLITCPPDAPVAQLAAALVERRAHAVVVEHEGRRAFIGDMDIVAAAVRDKPGRHDGAIAGAEPSLVSVDDDLELAARLMAGAATGHLIAVDAEGTPVGVLSALDIVGVIAAG